VTAAQGRSKGQGYNFGGAKAKALQATLRAIKEERERTGRVSMFDVKEPEPKP